MLKTEAKHSNAKNVHKFAVPEKVSRSMEGLYILKEGSMDFPSNVGHVPGSENINNNEYLPGRYKDLTSLKHTVLQIRALNHESLGFFIGFHL